MNNMVTIERANRMTGHDSWLLPVEEAVDVIIDNAQNDAFFAFVNGSLFPFTSDGGVGKRNFDNNSNRDRLRRELATVENPLVMLTGVLAGGCR